jgi:hypothetical protein
LPQRERPPLAEEKSLTSKKASLDQDAQLLIRDAIHFEAERVVHKRTYLAERGARVDAHIGVAEAISNLLHVEMPAVPMNNPHRAIRDAPRCGVRTTITRGARWLQEQ